MALVVPPLRERPAWSALADHREKIRGQHLRGLFAEDPDRGQRLTAEGVGIYLDYSKNRVTDETMQLLLDLAVQSGLRERIDAMFDGEKINTTEGRAVLHVALRAPSGEHIRVEGIDVVPAVHEVLGRANSPNGYAPDAGRATPASRSGTSSISASADRTSAR
jgi:glucose-6-phosphate isomerase